MVEYVKKSKFGAFKATKIEYTIGGLAGKYRVSISCMAGFDWREIEPSTIVEDGLLAENKYQEHTRRVDRLAEGKEEYPWRNLLE